MLAIFLDQETTGLDPLKHHVIEVALKVIDLTTGDVVTEYQSVVKQPQAVWDQRDPKSVEVNGFSWDDVKQGKELSVIRGEIIAAFTELRVERGRAVFICQNPAFDRPFFSQIIDVYTHEKLRWPYHWLDLASMFWAVKFHNSSVPDKISLSKDDIAKSFQLPKEERPHRAMNGVNHLIMCYNQVLKHNR